MPTRTRDPAAAYRLLLIGVDIDGTEALAYGEAVEVVNLPGQPQSITTAPVVALTGRTVIVRVLRETITAAALTAIEGQLSGPALSHGPMTLRHGALVHRPGMLAAPRASWSDHGVSLHPDRKFTYSLDEWWDAEETMVAQMWNSRAFREIGEAIFAETGVDLHYVSDRIGNFLRFERLSNWWIDSQPDPFSNHRWVRAMCDGPDPGTPLRLHLRFSEGTETVTEEVVELTPFGQRVASTNEYSRISFSLFDARSGSLLASDAAVLLGGSVSVATGMSSQGTVQDSVGVRHQVSWPAWPSGAPSRGIHPARPWLVRTAHRLRRNERLREQSSVVLFEENQRAAMLARLRDIVANRTAEFLDVWDPYLDGPGVRDVLNWLNPVVPCRVLCGGISRRDPTTDVRVSYLAAAVTALRTTPPARTIDGRYRVRSVGGNYLAIYHDRFFITRDAAWVLGASLNHIGQKPGSIVRLLDPARVRWLFDDAWNRTLPADVVELRL